MPTTLGVQTVADERTSRVTERDLFALSWCADNYAMPLDLLAPLTGSSDSAMRKSLARWRRAGWVESSSIAERAGERPVTWVWCTKVGIARFGAGEYESRPPAVGRLRHIRAVIMTRIAWELARGVPWTGERQMRHEVAAFNRDRAVRGHMPDGQIELAHKETGEPRLHAVEVELTRKQVSRLEGIMRELMSRSAMPDRRFAAAAYICADEVLPLVERAKGELPTTEQAGIGVYKLAQIEETARKELARRAEEGRTRAAAWTFPRRTREADHE